MRSLQLNEKTISEDSQYKKINRMSTGGGGDDDVIAAPIALHGVVYTAPQPPHHNHFTALFTGPPG